jgi:hypothetical protein
MPLPGRKRTSVVLLLVLAASLAAAAAAQDMACCPAGMEADLGCTWLGASDCCPERPGAPAPVNATPLAPTAFGPLTLPSVALATVAITPDALGRPSHVRTIVLRL